MSQVETTQRAAGAAGTGPESWTEAARTRALEGLLAATGWADARRSPLAGDASFRSYQRLERQGASAVLMNAPPGRERLEPFVRVAQLLTGVGLSAPRLLGADIAAGWLLLEDLGDQTFSRVLARGGEDTEAALYGLAVDTLAALHQRVSPQGLAALPAFDPPRALREAALLLDWYWPALHGGAAPEAVRSAFEAAWRAVFARCPVEGGSIALFDFHVDNLLLLEREGIAACGLLDFQDAVRAPPAFDLVSLLEDVRRTVAPALARAMIERYLDARAEAGIEREQFLTQYAVLGAQRNTRIAGTFARLLVRDAKPGYQRFMPRVWALIGQDLGHPALAPVAEWYARHLPPESRRILGEPAG